MSLYRKYRPQTFSEVIGQDHITELLLKQLETGKIVHAYLFSGPRGTGKTSTARIFAKAINCQKYEKSIGRFGEPCNKCDNCVAITAGNYLDVLEIDAASNRGIDEIRDLREKIRLAPTTGRYKVYIIDEVHMLTNEAFNALLKTLEEPPQHAVFILATTEPHKIPATILSRSQKFQFVRPKAETIEQKLQKISKEEKWQFNSEILKTIAEISEGAFRDAEVLLDKVSLMGTNDLKEIKKFLGRGGDAELVKFLKFILLKQSRKAVAWIEDFISEGGNPKILAEDILETLREVLLLKVDASSAEKKFSPEVYEELKNLSNQISGQKLSLWIKLFTDAVIESKESPIPSLPLELAILEAAEFDLEENSAAESKNLLTSGLSLEEQKVQEKKETKAGKVQKQETQPEKNVGKVENDPVKNDREISNLETPSKLRIEEVQKLWNELVNKVKEKNSSLGIFLKNALPVELEGDLLTLEVGYKFHKDRLEETKNSNLLSETIHSVLGKPVRIKGVVNESRSRLVRKETDQLDEADPVEIFGKLA